MNLSDPTWGVLVEIYGERASQDAKWGEQNLPDGTDAEVFAQRLAMVREQVEEANVAEKLTWAMVLGEKFCEAMAEEDTSDLRAELIQVAAVACAWVEAIDRRGRKA